MSKKYDMCRGNRKFLLFYYFVLYDMKKNFELTPELFKKLLEGNKESFIAAFNEEYYLSRKGIECVFPLLADNSARQAFFLKGTLSKDRKGIVDALDVYFSAYDFLFENQKYADIVELGYTEGAEFLYEKGAKSLLIEYAAKPEFIHPIAKAFYNKKEWLLLEGELFKEVVHASLFETSGVLAVQEKAGRNVKEALSVAYRGYEAYAGGGYRPEILYEVLSNTPSHLVDLCDAWYDWGKLPDADALEIWWYKNVENEVFKEKILKIFKKNRKILAALQDTNFPTTLLEIEKALNS